MNRQQRRRLELESKPKTYNLDMNRIKQAADEALKDRTNEIKRQGHIEAVECLMATFIISLHDDLGFGKKRIAKLLEKVDKQFKCLEFGFVEIQDLLSECDRIGVRVARIGQESI